MSIVTDPVMLDRTGQDISAKLQKIVDAINGGTIEPLTVITNGTYTPSGEIVGYGPVTVNVPFEGIPYGNSPPDPQQGSDGDSYVQIFPLTSGIHYVDYLESTGTQYINTGIFGNQDTGYLYDQETTIAAWGFGARQAAQSRAVVITSQDASTTTNTFDLGSERKTISNIPARRKMVLKNRNLYINGVLKARYGMPSEFTTPNPLILFGVYNGSSISLSTGGFKVYRAVIYDGYMPVADYIPCLDGNGIACMWNNIANQYVYNSGSNTFGYGGNVIPDQLEPILWQKQSGSWVIIGG